MTPQELKNSILQLAIQGKLVEQRPEEGAAEGLLVGVKTDDQVDGRRVKGKEISQISEDDIPFELPDSWEWVKLGSVCTIARGGSPRPIKDYITDDANGINWIKIGDTEKNGKYISSTAEKIKPSGVSKSRMVHAGDFLLTNSMSFGRPYILKTDGCIHDGWLVISQGTEVFDQDYLYWTLSSGFAYSQFCGKVSGAVVKNLNSDKVANAVFPLPPLAEQKRIVAKIEELLPLIERYEKAWSRLEDFNKRFPVDMQKSILQMAIQGKLVEQRPEEGTAEELYKHIQAEKQALIKAGKIKKEKPLPEITEDEIPFEIPESWKWAKLGDLAWFLDAGKSPNCQKVPVKGEEWGVITTTAIQLGFFDEIQNKVLPESFTVNYSMQVKAGDILITRAGPTNRTGVACLVKEIHYNLILSDKTLRINMTDEHIYKDYIVMVLNSPQIRQLIIGLMSGMDKQQVNISQDKYKTVLVPLPPLAEQKRIVARLEELLPLCERLK